MFLVTIESFLKSQQRIDNILSCKISNQSQKEKKKQFHAELFPIVVNEISSQKTKVYREVSLWNKK